MNTSDITFPITLESFCKMAEHITGRSVSDDWRDVYKAIVPVINDSYRLGLSGKPRETLDIEAAVHRVARQGNENFVRRFALSLEYWCELAYSCGKKKYNMGY